MLLGGQDTTTLTLLPPRSRAALGTKQDAAEGRGSASAAGYGDEHDPQAGGPNGTIHRADLTGTGTTHQPTTTQSFSGTDHIWGI